MRLFALFDQQFYFFNYELNYNETQIIFSATALINDQTVGQQLTPTLKDDESGLAALLTHLPHTAFCPQARHLAHSTYTW